MSDNQIQAVAWFDANPTIASVVFADNAGRDRYVTRLTVTTDEHAAKLILSERERTRGFDLLESLGFQRDSFGWLVTRHRGLRFDLI
jgi:hypothetical protein